MRPTYRVEKYAADGSHGSADDYVIATGVPTLAEARAIVRKHMRLSRLTASRRWSGVGNDVEAYHDMLRSEPGSDGCGGVAITAEDEDD